METNTNSKDITIEEINSGYGAHGDNERVSEEAFIEMVKFIWNTVIEVAAANKIN